MNLSRPLVRTALTLLHTDIQQPVDRVPPQGSVSRRSRANPPHLTRLSRHARPQTIRRVAYDALPSRIGVSDSSTKSLVVSLRQE